LPAAGHHRLDGLLGAVYGNPLRGHAPTFTGVLRLEPDPRHEPYTTIATACAGAIEACVARRFPLFASAGDSRNEPFRSAAADPDIRDLPDA